MAGFSPAPAARGRSREHRPPWGSPAGSGYTPVAGSPVVWLRGQCGAGTPAVGWGGCDGVTM